MSKGIANHSVKIFSLYDGIPLYNSKSMRTVRSISAFSKSEVAGFRLKVIEFHKTYGTKATIAAYEVTRPTLYRWRKILADNLGRLESLIPSSTAPKRRRVMITHPKVIEFIKQIREKYNHLGKEKIKPLLDEYCQKEKIVSVSESTIGKVIKRYNFYPKSRRIYHNPSHSHSKAKLSYKTKVKRSPKPVGAGYVEVDTIVRFIHGIKLYVLNAVDVNLKFQFSYGYTRLNSRNSTDFLKRLELVYPIINTIHSVQTDNGLEFMGEFDEYLKAKNIKHLFIYPRCPKINAYVERANRTLVEEFLEGNEHLVLDNITDFNCALVDYLVWYNTKRVHKSLGNVSPINHLLKILPPKSQMYVTYTTRGTFKLRLYNKLIYNRLEQLLSKDLTSIGYGT